MDIGLDASASATLDNLSVYLEASMCLTEGCKLTLDTYDTFDLLCFITAAI